MTGIQPELWVERAGEAVEFYEAAFGASSCIGWVTVTTSWRSLPSDDAVFWVTAASPEQGRLSPAAINGATDRTLLVVDDPDAVFRQALDAGARERRPGLLKNMVGISVASSTRSVTSGRSVDRLATGLHPDRRRTLRPRDFSVHEPPVLL